MYLASAKPYATDFNYLTQFKIRSVVRSKSSIWCDKKQKPAFYLK